MLQFFDIQPRIDRFNDAHIDFSDSSTDFQTISATEFSSELSKYHNNAVNQQITSLWFRVPNKHSTITQFLLSNGFDYHHARPGFAVLYKWILSDQLDRVPHYAHNMVGVGAFVYNSLTDSVLLVKENAGERPNWKFPGGVNDPGENFETTAIREVFEETGVECRFHSVLLFRHKKRGVYDCSDIYIVCLLFPLQPDDCVPSKCDFEIEACQWTTIETAKHLLANINSIVLDRFSKQFGAESNQTPERNLTIVAERSNTNETIVYKLDRMSLEEDAATKTPDAR